MNKVERNIRRLEKKVPVEVQDRLYESFCKHSSYVGSSTDIYKISGLYSIDTRELFLMYCEQQMKVEEDRTAP